MTNQKKNSTASKRLQISFVSIFKTGLSSHAQTTSGTKKLWFSSNMCQIQLSHHHHHHDRHQHRHHHPESTSTRIFHFDPHNKSGIQIQLCLNSPTSTSSLPPSFLSSSFTIIIFIVIIIIIFFSKLPCCQI